MFSGQYALFEGNLDRTVRLPGSKSMSKEQMPFMTILRIENCMVVEQRDNADYHPYLAAYRAATE
ncbi:MAG: hypothetical protein K9M98_06575 [Cephaloticoccus sp.]|nr:hypothetical protein [Cephaloticoccus sp.]MCF7760152.1 hypothetical protein [Cephaloticoccus sp.]